MMSGGILAATVLAVFARDDAVRDHARGPAGAGRPVNVDGRRRGVLASAHARIAPTEEVAGVCRVCHIPHIQVVRPAAPPATQPTTQPVLELYRMPGQRRVFAPGEFTPGPTSVVCLACHDGTIGTSGHMPCWPGRGRASTFPGSTPGATTPSGYRTPAIAPTIVRRRS